MKKQRQFSLSVFVANAMYMGSQEMRKVLERDNVTIRKNLDKVRKVISALNHCQSIHDRVNIQGNVRISIDFDLSVSICPIYSLYFITELQTIGALYSIIMTSSRTFHMGLSNFVKTGSATPLSWMQEEK